MSPEAKVRMRNTERTEYRYYNDMGENRGHCTWGAGILAHRGVCTPEELTRVVSAAEVNAEFDRRVREAEATIHRNIHVALNQAQFDALVSFTYNAGPDGSADTYALINKNDFKGAGANMQKFIRVKVKTKTGTKKVIARGLVTRRAQESAPFLKSDADASAASN
ncbi:lysozyme [Pseudoduganella armeniaca]|nr:glycoside hydrolase family protein [Pseudoduganella armeniaca]